MDGLGTNSAISQRIDLSVLGAYIDDPGVDYVLSGWLGSRGSQAAAARLSARFLDVAGLPLGTNNLGPVRAGDRGGATGLLERSGTGRLPLGTRFVEFVLSAQAPTSTNDASADNLSFVLTPRPDPSFAILTGPWTNGARRVELEGRTNRLYSLQRSLRLDSWETVGAAVLGNGGRLTLLDTNSPPGQAFYRTFYRRP
jgi:hypothetical protein